MRAFEYLAVDSRGRDRRGVMEGDTRRHVRQRLREQGLVPVTVSEAGRHGERRRGARRARPIGGSALALLTRQLATLVSAGSSIEDALGAVARQSTARHHEAILLGVRAHILEGYPLAEGLAQFPGAFPAVYRATVAAGEQSGHLGEVLGYLADHTERSLELRRTVSMALLYPGILTLVALAIVAGLLAYVVPQVVQIFEGSGQPLPWPTRLLIQGSDLVRDHGLQALALGIVVVLGARASMRFAPVRRQAHRFVLTVPLLARLLRGIDAARFAGTLGILVGSGVALVDALRIAAGVIAVEPTQAAALETARKVAEGGSLCHALRASGRFPPVMVELIASGEASGHLDAMLSRAARSQEKESHALMLALVGVFEPLLVLAMGAVVVGIVMAILLPIFELSQLVG
jgi:general secretion pathway protein F